MKRVIIESPFAGDMTANLEFARLCMRDSLDRGEAPFASHLLYTQVLDDTKAEERRRGIAEGLVWGEHADAVVVYADRGISPGMEFGIQAAKSRGVPIEYRMLRASAKVGAK